MIEAEAQAETARVLERVGAGGAIDLEASEFYIRTAMLAAGATVLERLLQTIGRGRRAEPCHCARNHPPVAMRSSGVRVKSLQTILGTVRWERSRFVCPLCGAVEFPGDTLLGVEATGFSPGLRRLLTRAGSRESFAEAAADLKVYGAITVDPKDVERVAEATGRRIDAWMARQGSAARLRPAAPALATSAPDPIGLLYIALDGTGAPMRKSQLLASKGKGSDGRAKTREVKLGCVFTQTRLDEQGRPVRDPISTSYVGAIESSVDFGHRLAAEAARRGAARAGRRVVLSDGAEYNASIVRDHFPDATHIIDFYHAVEHLDAFFREQARLPLSGRLHHQCYALLKAGRIEALKRKMLAALPRSGPRRRDGLTAIAYFERRREQMRYGRFRKDGLFVGSGVIEAGCRTLIGKRLKQSGMFWTVKGANAIIAARCCLYSGRFEQFWEDAAA